MLHLKLLAFCKQLIQTYLLNLTMLDKLTPKGSDRLTYVRGVPRSQLTVRLPQGVNHSSYWDL